MNIKTTLLITKKELKHNLDHITGYLLISLFLLVTYFFFLRPFFLTQNASLRDMFALLPWILIIFIPAVTMGSFAQERDKQTIEYLLSKPISVIELVIGKILGASAFISLALLLTLPLPFFISKLGYLDLGETFAGYLSSILLIVSLTSVGVGISSLFKNQISAFLTTTVTILVLTLIGSELFSLNVPITISRFFALFSITGHYQSMARGVLEFSDLGYFVLVTLIFSALAYVSVQNIRISKIREVIRKAILTTLVIAAITFSISFLSTQTQSRIDLTSSRKYTLSNVTKEVLSEKGKVEIKVYQSQNLPNQFQVVANELKNILSDYEAIGKGNIKVNYFDPKTSEADLKTYAIAPIQFNVIGEDKFQVQQGYLAVVIENENKSKTEKINFVNDVGNLEYELTRLIYKIKSDSKNKIAFASGNGEKSIFSDLTYLKRFLQDEYELTSVTLTGQSTDKETDNSKPEDINLEGISLLVLADPTAPYTQSAKDKIIEFVNSGGNVLYMTQAVDVTEEILLATKHEDRGQLFKDLGITVNTDLLYDPKTSISVMANAGNQPIRITYPMIFPIYKTQKGSELLANAPQTLIVAWPNSLNITDDSWNVLYETSDTTSAQTDEYVLDFTNKWTPNNPKKYPIIAQKAFENGGRVIVISSASLFKDEYIQNSQENAVLALSIFEGLGQGRNFSEIQAKNILASRFNLVTPAQKTGVNVIAPAISFVFLIAIGVSSMYRKRILKAKIEAKSTTEG